MSMNFKLNVAPEQFLDFAATYGANLNNVLIRYGWLE
jgi:hypothetical protein